MGSDVPFSFGSNSKYALVKRLKFFLLDGSGNNIRFMKGE